MHSRMVVFPAPDSPQRIAVSFSTIRSISEPEAGQPLHESSNDHVCLAAFTRAARRARVRACRAESDGRGEHERKDRGNEQVEVCLRVPSTFHRAVEGKRESSEFSPECYRPPAGWRRTRRRLARTTGLLRPGFPGAPGEG